MPDATHYRVALFQLAWNAPYMTNENFSINLTNAWRPGGPFTLNAALTNYNGYVQQAWAQLLKLMEGECPFGVLTTAYNPNNWCAYSMIEWPTVGPSVLTVTSPGARVTHLLTMEAAIDTYAPGQALALLEHTNLMAYIAEREAEIATLTTSLLGLVAPEQSGDPGTANIDVTVNKPDQKVDLGVATALGYLLGAIR